MAKKPESRLQLAIQTALRQEFPGCYVRKIHGNEFQHAGIPDLVCCVQGFFIAFEVKMPGGRPSPLQENEIKEIRRAGGYAYIVSSVAEAVSLVARVVGIRRE